MSDFYSNIAFAFLCRAEKLPQPVPEYKFHPTRKWRFDYAWPEQKIALEIEGGVWTGGRHTSGSGFMKDIEKYNTATVMGWRVLRTVPGELLKVETTNMIREAMTA